MNNWLIVWRLTPFSTVFQLYRSGQCTYPCFPRVLLTSIPHNILSKPMTVFPHNHCRNNGRWWERNESCRNDYHQSSERILAEPGIEPATAFSQVQNPTDWAVGLLYSVWSEGNLRLALKVCTSLFRGPCCHIGLHIYENTIYKRCYR